MKKFMQKALLFIILLMILIFSIQNFSLVMFTFINWKLEIHVFVAMVMIYVLGAISGSLFLSLIKSIAKDTGKAGSHEEGSL
jgi:uncharacterized integral membrane protein